ncbi:hypothetical protein BYT27DRAFT_7105218, partial [Phlegmacium glaucopus]
SFNAKEHRIMCFPHIINIAVQQILSKMTSVKAPEGKGDDYDLNVSNGDNDREHGTRQTFEDACAQDPIDRLCNTVVAIRASGQHRDAFMAWVKTGNENSWFMNKGQAVQIAPKQLLQDIHTRWDSTYQIIRRCIEMHLAINSFIKCPVGDLEHLALTKMEWDVLQEFTYILSFPHAVQQVLSGEKTPLLAGIIPVFEVFITGWEKLSTKWKHLACFIQPGLDRAYKYYSRTDNMNAYVVGMCMFIN